MLTYKEFKKELQLRTECDEETLEEMAIAGWGNYKPDSVINGNISIFGIESKYTLVDTFVFAGEKFDLYKTETVLNTKYVLGNIQFDEKENLDNFQH